MVYWMERRISWATDLRPSRRRRQSRTTFLQATPIDVSELLSELVFEQIPTVVLTSATLTVQGGFEHMRKRLGLSEARELVVPSHFKYGEQALLYLPPEMPDPRDPGVSRSRRALHPARAGNHPRPRLLPLHQLRPDARPIRAPAAGAGLSHPAARHRPRKALLEQFRATPNAVLFGTSSFWQGVDVQGEALSCVIIDRCPSPCPATRWSRRA
jgi:ATP-dependent DNA helicase DinG